MDSERDQEEEEEEEGVLTSDEEGGGGDREFRGHVHDGEPGRRPVLPRGHVVTDL